VLICAITSKDPFSEDRTVNLTAHWQIVFCKPLINRADNIPVIASITTLLDTGLRELIQLDRSSHSSHNSISLAKRPTQLGRKNPYHCNNDSNKLPFLRISAQSRLCALMKIALEQAPGVGD
jgi:hypothetical protein